MARSGQAARMRSSCSRWLSGRVSGWRDPGGDPAGAGDRLRRFRGGSAGAEGRDAFGDDDAAAAVAAFADLAEEGRSVGRAAAETVLQVGLDRSARTDRQSPPVRQGSAKRCSHNAASSTPTGHTRTPSSTGTAPAEPPPPVAPTARAPPRPHAGTSAAGPSRAARPPARRPDLRRSTRCCFSRPSSRSAAPRPCLESHRPTCPRSLSMFLAVWAVYPRRASQAQ